MEPNNLDTSGHLASVHAVACLCVLLISYLLHGCVTVYKEQTDLGSILLPTVGLRQTFSFSRSHSPLHSGENNTFLKVVI